MIGPIFYTIQQPLCSHRDNYIHDEFSCKHAHQSSGRNINEEEIVTTMAN